MTAERSYYGQPIVKRPEWTWEVPWYFFVGGLAGMSSVVAWVARRRGDAHLAGRMRAVAAAGAVVSPALLISDLGRPKRFLNMLRVFKPTSAMSVGSWILTGYSGAATGAAVLPRRGAIGWFGAAAEAMAAALGLGMATYTAVLVADSSIPAWHEARAHLPFLFGASATACAGAAATLLAPGDQGPGRRLAIGGVAAELFTATAMERSLGDLGEVYRSGTAGRFQQAASVCSALGGAAVLAGGGRRRPLAAGGAVLILAGSVCQRWAVYKAGFASAADPAYVVGPQRRRREGLW